MHQKNILITLLFKMQCRFSRYDDVGTVEGFFDGAIFDFTLIFICARHATTTLNYTTRLVCGTYHSSNMNQTKTLRDPNNFKINTT